MNEEIRVHVARYPDRANLVMRYRDPASGKLVQRSTGTSNQREAEKRAAKWEAEVQDGRYVAQSKLTWDAFRKRYETRSTSKPIREGTRARVAAVFNTFEEIVNPQRLRDVTAARLQYYREQLEKRGRAISTIRTHLAHLNAAFRWAARKSIGLIHEAPTAELPTGKTMKGRPITTEEYERMLAAVPKALSYPCGKGWKERKPAAQAVVESWQRLLTGLWLSGLRLGEAMNLSWDDRPDRLSIDLRGRYPMIRIPGALQKSGKDQVCAIVPDFAEFLLKTPPKDRRGPAFDPLPLRGKRPNLDGVSRTITRIGKKARVVAAVDPETNKPTKWASAHDFRRSFGTRWAKRVMPAVLKDLMRHTDIQTTMRYYVDQDANDTAAALWQAHGGPGLHFGLQCPATEGEAHEERAVTNRPK